MKEVLKDKNSLRKFANVLLNVANILETYNKRKKSDEISYYVAELRELAGIMLAASNVEDMSTNLFKKLYYYIGRLF